MVIKTTEIFDDNGISVKKKNTDYCVDVDMDKMVEICNTFSTFCALHPFCGVCPANPICGQYLPYGVELMEFMKELKNVLNKND